MKLVAVVLSGGSGSRLWPLSTDSLPKPFLPLFGEKNLLEKTLYRLSFLPLQATLIVTNQKYYTLHKAKSNFTAKETYCPIDRKGTISPGWVRLRKNSNPNGKTIK